MFVQSLLFVLYFYIYYKALKNMRFHSFFFCIPIFPFVKGSYRI